LLSEMFLSLLLSLLFSRSFFILTKSSPILRSSLEVLRYFLHIY
jgi:hypothetical protein